MEGMRYSNPFLDPDDGENIPIDDDDPNLDNETDVEAVNEDYYEPCGLESREQERAELGLPDSRSTCFGCVYVGEREKTAIPYTEIMDLIEMARGAMGCTDPITLAKEMADRYARMRREINNSMLPGERPLPEWTAATILDHIRLHNQDAETQLWVTLTEIQELKQAALEGAVERHRGTKRKRVNDKQVAAYERLVKLQYYVAAKDASKLAFYSGGGHLDPKTLSQGMMALSGKNIVSMWDGALKKRRTRN